MLRRMYHLVVLVAVCFEPVVLPVFLLVLDLVHMSSFYLSFSTSGLPIKATSYQFVVESRHFLMLEGLADCHKVKKNYFFLTSEDCL